jgi:hypothetical protein
MTSRTRTSSATKSQQAELQKILDKMTGHCPALDRHLQGFSAELLGIQQMEESAQEDNQQKIAQKSAAALQQYLGELDRKHKVHKRSNVDDPMKMAAETIEQSKTLGKQAFNSLKQALENQASQETSRFNAQSVIAEVKGYCENLEPRWDKISQRLQLVSVQSQHCRVAPNQDLHTLVMAHLVSHYQIQQQVVRQALEQKFFPTIEQILQPSNLLNSSHLSALRVQAQYGPLNQLVEQNLAIPEDSIRRRQTNVFSYALRQIRTQWMGLMFFMMFFSAWATPTGRTGRRAMIGMLIQPLQEAKSDPLKLFMLIGLIVVPVVMLIAYNYFQDQDFNLDKEADSVRKSLCDYYQKFAEQQIDRIVADCDRVVSEEEDRFDRLLKRLEVDLKHHTAVQQERIKAQKEEINALEKVQREVSSAIEKLKAYSPE